MGLLPLLGVFLPSEPLLPFLYARLSHDAYSPTVPSITTFWVYPSNPYTLKRKRKQYELPAQEGALPSCSKAVPWRGPVLYGPLLQVEKASSPVNWLNSDLTQTLSYVRAGCSKARRPVDTEPAMTI